MNLNLDDWEDADAFNLLQVLLTAKFDSGRSSEMMGSPLITSLVRQVLDHSFKNALYAKLIANVTATRIGNDAIKRMEAILAQTKPNWADDELESFIKAMAYPFIISDAEVSVLKTQRRMD